MTRSQTKRRFCQFRRSYVTLDFRDTMKARAERYADKHGFTGCKAVFS